MGLALPASLLPGGALIAALLTAARLGLFGLPDAAAVGFVGRLSDLAHVVAVLNHVLAAEAALVVSILCHKHSSLLLRPAAANNKALKNTSVQCQRVR